MEEGIILPTNQVVSMLSVSHSRVQLFVIPWTVACQAPLSMEFSRQVGCHPLLQGIFLTQGPNSGLLHCRQILCRLSHQGSQVASLLNCQK